MTNDYFNMDRIKWYDKQGKTYFKEGVGVILPSYGYSLEYTDVNGFNKFVIFDGYRVRKFDEIDDALDWVEESGMGMISNRKEVIEQWNKYKKRKKVSYE